MIAALAFSILAPAAGESYESEPFAFSIEAPAGWSVTEKSATETEHHATVFRCLSNARPLYETHKTIRTVQDYRVSDPVAEIFKR